MLKISTNNIIINYTKYGELKDYGALSVEAPNNEKAAII